MKTSTEMRVLLISCLVIAVTSEEVTQSCLQCICKASSGCNLETKCHNSGSNSYFCGPYQISWAYWSDAGKPGNTGQSNDFEQCLNDKNCAEVAVRGYMSKWKRDCNRDGIIDCLDFAAIHKSGADSCDQQWIYNSQYWNVFRQCQITASPGLDTGPSVKPLQPSQPYPSDPWPQNQPQPQDRPKPIQPKPDNTYPQPQPDPWNQPQPQTDPWNQPQPQPDSRPVLKPTAQPRPRPIPIQPAPQPDYSYGQPTPDPWDQPQPQPQPDPWNQPQPQPNRPVLKPTVQPRPRPVPIQPDNSDGQPQPDPWDQPQPQPDTYKPPQPAPDQPWESDPAILKPYPAASYDNSPQPLPSLNPQRQPQTQPQPSDPWNQPTGDQPYPNPPEVDPWDEVARAVDELTRPTPKPQNNPKPTQPDPWPVNPAPQPNGRAPTEPVSWAPTGRPSNSFGQPYSPNSGHNSQPSSTLIEVSAVANNISVDQNCLECICQASSDCDLNKQCEGSYCGPYLISWAYWSDGGQPGGDYVTCANNKGCAEQALQGYMNKWQTDCNGDGLIDCTDFAAIHKLGPHSCSSQSIHGTDYWTSYELCKSPKIDARRLPSDTSSEAPVGRSVGLQSGPSANLFLEYPNPRYIEPKPVETSNPLPSRYSGDSRIVFPSDQSQSSRARAQPNGYGGTSPPISPINANNSSNERAFEELGLNRECLDCICHASSRCDPNIGCRNDGKGGYLCGPYQMSWAQFSDLNDDDAGKPGISGNLENLENFRSCLNNKECSEATIYGYMKKWRRDCNEDRQINCYDMAAVHMAGPTNCNAQWLLESQYWSDFRECFDFRRR